ncbi:MAG: pentapeptide repeat-containing protein [Actinomycetota bacterium]|nr:pentapeptide repeat-containing protein [Actinomycetota bacterium]
MTGLRSLTDILSEGRTLPDGYDTWGWKAVRPDLRTRDGYRWPWPGQVAEAADPEPGPEVCARGLHIALKPEAAIYPLATLLLLAYRQADVIAADDVKCRVPRCLVVDVIDLPGVGRAGKLGGADLAGADLRGADLGGADLAGADLTRGQLTDAQHAQITGTPNWITS